jgi:hypothetical protein
MAMKKLNYTRAELLKMFELVIFISTDLSLVASSSPLKSFRNIKFQ